MGLTAKMLAMFKRGTSTMSFVNEDRKSFMEFERAVIEFSTFAEPENSFMKVVEMAYDNGKVEHKTKKILITGDYEFKQKAIKSVLEEAGFEVVGMVDSGIQAVEHAIRLRPDVIIMDIMMNELNGLASLSMINKILPGIQIMVLGTCFDQLYMVSAVEIDAAIFLPYEVTPTELIIKIRETTYQADESISPY